MPLLLHAARTEYRKIDKSVRESDFRWEEGGKHEINLHIERLVLDGVGIAPHQRAGLKAAVEAELADALARTGSAPACRAGAACALCGRLITVGEQNEPTRLGQQMGRRCMGGQPVKDGLKRIDFRRAGQYA